MIGNEIYISKISKPLIVNVGIKHTPYNQSFVMLLVAYKELQIAPVKLKHTFEIEEEFLNLDYPPIDLLMRKLKKEMKKLTHQKKMKIVKSR